MTAGGVTPVSDADQPVFDHLDRLTDERRLFEHARHAIPRREHGYCVDDAARGLVVMCHEPEPGPTARRLARCYLAFVLGALDAHRGRHNRMAVGGQWCDETGTGDWWGRALWGLGAAAASAPTPGMRARALGGFRIAAQRRSPHLRSMSFAALGAAELLSVRPDELAARALLTDMLAVVGRPRIGDPGWPWPEERLSYANASILPRRSSSRAMPFPMKSALNRGLNLLDFLLRTQTRDGHLSVTPAGRSWPWRGGPRFRPAAHRGVRARRCLRERVPDHAPDVLADGRRPGLGLVWWRQRQRHADVRPPDRWRI